MSELRKHSAWLGVWLLAAYSAMAAAPPPARVIVVDVLRALSAAGVNVLYSTDLVPGTLDAPDALPHGNPMSRAVAALAANGLILRRTGESTYVVTQGRPTTRPSAAKAPAAAPRAVLDEVSVFASRYEFTAGKAGEPVEYNDRQIEECREQRPTRPAGDSCKSRCPSLRPARRRIDGFGSIAHAAPNRPRGSRDAFGKRRPSCRNVRADRPDSYASLPESFGTCTLKSLIR